MRIHHTMTHQGHLVVLENVPAEVCSVCGDELLSLETVRSIEALLQNPGKPAHTVPAYVLPAAA